jgi:hypothetical protein
MFGSIMMILIIIEIGIQNSFNKGISQHQKKKTKYQVTSFELESFLFVENGNDPGNILCSSTIRPDSSALRQTHL